MTSIIVLDADGNSRVLKGKPFPYEEVLQRNLAELPSLIPLDMVTGDDIRHCTIGWEWPLGNGRADIVMVGSDGLLTVVETKLRRNAESRREVVAQLLEYAAYVSEWTIYQIQEKADSFFSGEDCPQVNRGQSFDSVLESLVRDPGTTVDSFKANIEHNLHEGRLRLIVAVDEVGEQALKIITFVNAYSSFDLYLLEVAAYEDEGGQRIFVPTLHGYARKVSTVARAPREEWDWGKYQEKRGWSEDDVKRVEKGLDRLKAISEDWSPEVRFNQDWINVFCFGRYTFGVQVTKKAGIEFMFPNLQDVEIPGSRREPKTLYIREDSNPSDALLRDLCRTSLERQGILPIDTP